MKATLEFTLPEEEPEFLDAANVLAWKLTVYDMDEWLRRESDSDSGRPEAELTILAAVRARLFETLQDRGLLLD